MPILVNSAPLSDALGASAGGVAVFQDITPLRDLDRQKDEFLAAISHDLKTPATIIKGRANLLQRALRTHPESIPDLAEGLEAIDDTTAQLVRIVDELLDQTRVRMGQPFELDRGPLGPAQDRPAARPASTRTSARGTRSASTAR